ncbi:MAG: type IV pilus secretin PilQ [Acidobacteriota bacterium]
MAFAAGALAAAFGCATARHQDATGAAAAPANATSTESPANPSPRAAGRIEQAAFTEDADGARLVLSADAPILYTAYEPRPDLLVIDLPGFAVADAFAAPAASGDLVKSVRFEPVSELGKSLTRVTIAHREGSRYDVRSLGQGLAVAFEGARVASAADESSPAAASTVEPAAPVAAAEPPAPYAAPSPSSRVEIGHALEDVTAVPSTGGVEVALLGDGALAAKDFVLANPPRIVVDLPGVKNEVRRRVVPVKSAMVSRIRISQFQTQPEPVTRVVVDLTAPTAYSLRADGERLALIVGRSDAVALAPAEAPAPAPAQASTEKLVPSDRPADVAAAGVEKPAEAPAVADAGKTAEAPASVTRVADGSAAAPDASAPPASPVAQTRPSAPAAAPQPVDASPAATATAPAQVKSEPAAVAPSHAEPVAAPPAAASEPAPVAASKPLEPPVAPAAVPAPKAAPRRSEKGKPAREDALFEAAAAMLDQQESPRPDIGNFQPRTIAESQSQFTGEPISLDLKDADIKDVFRTISELTGLNIVVDPEVRGTVTVKLDNVPWDQALDLILKQNGLGYVLENNIMRIATTAKLQAEQADRARLAEARQAAEPTRTVIKKLSYTKAAEIVPVLKSIMSKRGDIVVDTRTNTLIIREIPTYMPAVLQLIDNLDTATPQVMIEARIVETTKSLGRSLGINWGINGVADNAHGNTTGLVFPNSIGGSFNVPLATGTPIGALRLANILDSFNLDIALSAAENQGLLKIISSPKVAALTNTAALIQSGVQIPVQTNVNNTTTVIYVDATLQLSVTPQITNEGTIMLTLNVQKREPAVALNLSLGQNVPLSIRQYRGEVLVRDGGTTVIGGIFQINDQDQNNMIPGLWKIPILGNLFKNKTRTEKHDELLIFITPRILRS